MMGQGASLAVRQLFPGPLEVLENEPHVDYIVKLGAEEVWPPDGVQPGASYPVSFAEREVGVILLGEKRDQPEDC